MFCGFSLVCGVCLWYFLIILTYCFDTTNWNGPLYILRGRGLKFPNEACEDFLSYANSVDPDGMPNPITFHFGLHLSRPLLENYFLYFSSKTYFVGTNKNRLNETILLSTQNTCFYGLVRILLQFYVKNALSETMSPT